MKKRFVLGVMLVVLVIAGALNRHEIKAWLMQHGEAWVLRNADHLPLARAGEYLFDQHCADCHDNPAMNSPTRQALSLLAKEDLMIALEFGKMQPMAAHLSKQQRGLIAHYLAGSASGQYDWLASAMCDPEPARSRSPVVGSWGVGLENRRFVSDQQTAIRKDNVGSLSLAWSFAFPRVSDMRSQPAVIGERIFIGDKAGKLFVLDRRSGCVIAHRKMLSGIRSAITVATLGDSRQLLIFADSLATIYAVDPNTLDIVWQQSARLNDFSLISGSISFHNNKLYVPVSLFEVAAAGSESHVCCTSHGGVMALNAETGNKVWTWHATDEATLQGSNRAGQDRYGPSGAAVWSSPTIDTKRNRLYVGTGENLTRPATDTSDAIIALDLDSGEVVWKFQAISGDVWNAGCLNGGANCPSDPGEDFDFGASVILATLSSGKQVLFAGQKSGEVFALDPDADGANRVLWRQRLSQGTSNGGIHWGMALAGDSLYVPVSDPEREQAGYTPRPGLYALNGDSGELLWRYTATRNCDFDYSKRPLVGLENNRAGGKVDLTDLYRCSFYYGLSAAVTATAELVFSAGLDGEIRAFDRFNGELLWSRNTAQPISASNGIDGHGGAIDVGGQIIVGDWLYVSSGYSMFGQLPGNVLLAYKILR
ncbi:outer membrane protein assembly factor BamB family protein [Zhongshania arctica]|uniref:PQQ-binding-like beta-propeller repeat protein n=1 Tax=Zhongshania arctica TaxID=3238302 RepID=A0ABV3TZA5_9GAMM